jgi:hypothetical protein
MYRSRARVREGVQLWITTPKKSSDFDFPIDSTYLWVCNLSTTNPWPQCGVVRGNIQVPADMNSACRHAAEGKVEPICPATRTLPSVEMDLEAYTSLDMEIVGVGSVVVWAEHVPHARDVSILLPSRMREIHEYAWDALSILCCEDWRNWYRPHRAAGTSNQVRRRERAPQAEHATATSPEPRTKPALAAYGGRHVPSNPELINCMNKKQRWGIAQFADAMDQDQIGPRSTWGGGRTILSLAGVGSHVGVVMSLMYTEKSQTTSTLRPERVIIWSAGRWAGSGYPGSITQTE